MVAIKLGPLLLNLFMARYIWLRSTGKDMFAEAYTFLKEHFHIVLVTNMVAPIYANALTGRHNFALYFILFGLGEADLLACEKFIGGH